MSWNLKLMETMKDPASIVMKGEKLVTIKDKFPKAKHHFLVLPHEKIDTIFHLTKQDVKLVKEMEEMAKKVIEDEGLKEENFKIGFHAEPSMIRVHLHVISRDFISDTLKTKKHWNSFNTDFLWPVAKIIDDLESFGTVRKLKHSEIKQLLDTPLKCNTCEYSSKTIPDLKRHLLTHESFYQ